MQIKLLTLDSSGYTLEEQYDKIKEEFEEVKEAYCKNEYEFAAELFDLMQACKTCLEILANSKKSYIGYNHIYSININHIAKLKKRHEEGKIKLIEDESL